MFAGELTSRSFDDYCITLGIDVEHHVPRVRTQNAMLNDTLLAWLRHVANH